MTTLSISNMRDTNKKLGLKMKKKKKKKKKGSVLSLHITSTLTIESAELHI